MPTISPESGTGRYIVRALDPARLVEFVDDVRKDPDMEVVELIGPADQPHTAVVVMQHAVASALAQRFLASHQLTIEPDRPLSLFGGM